MQDSKISVVLPVRNGERYIPYISELISNSCSDSDEIIVLSDGSQDSSLSKLKIWAKQDSRVNLVDTGGIGLVNSLNLGLKLASNEWIARYDVDDRYEDIRLKIQKPFLTQNVAAVFTDYQFRSKLGIPLGRVLSAIHPQETAISLVSGARTPHPSVIFNRDKAQAVGGYRSEDFPAEDLSLWMRMSFKGQLISVPQTLLKYTLSKKSITATQISASCQKRSELVANYVKGNYKEFGHLEGLSETRERYESQKDGLLRYLLHLRDLHLVGSILGEDQAQSKKIKSEVIRTLLHDGNLPNLTSIFLSKAARDFYRFF